MYILRSIAKTSHQASSACKFLCTSARPHSCVLTPPKTRINRPLRWVLWDTSLGSATVSLSITDLDSNFKSRKRPYSYSFSSRWVSSRGTWSPRASCWFCINRVLLPLDSSIAHLEYVDKPTLQFLFGIFVYPAPLGLPKSPDDELAHGDDLRRLNLDLLLI